MNGFIAKRKPGNALKESLSRNVFRLVGSTSIFVVLLIFLFIGRESLPFVTENGAGALIDPRWAPVSMTEEKFGLLPLMGGSLLVTLLAAILAIPVSVCAAVYMAELAGEWENRLLKPFIEILAGIPSVVIGFFGLIVLAPLIKEWFHLSSGLTALTGGILLALMAAPTIVSISEDALKSVPRSYAEASMAMGATRMQTIWRVLVPAAVPGITAAAMLGIGRVIGETMAVLMVTGNAALLTPSPLESVRTMTATIAAEMGEVAFGTEHYHALFCVGTVLLLVTFGLNLAARMTLRKYRVQS